MLTKLIKTISRKFSNIAKRNKKTDELLPDGEGHGVVATASSSESAEARGKSESPPPEGESRHYRRPKAPRAEPRPAWDLAEFQVTPAEGRSRFHDFPLPVEIMHALADLKFQYCTPIQAATLEHTLAGGDLIGRAQTGTGKTAAFLIAIFTHFLNKPRSGIGPATPRALIIAPTRELVIQIAKDAQSLAKYLPFKSLAVFGGTDFQKQQDQLESKSIDVVVATPGRLLDFQRRQVVDLSKVEIMVIDEADRMLDMGFIPDVRRIIQCTPPKDRRQTLLFSATITPAVKDLSAQWCTKPLSIDIEPEQVTVETVEQVVYLTTTREKYTVLYNVITQQNLSRVMIFTNRKDETRKLTERLKRNNINCAMISGDVAQNVRTNTLENFRNGKIRVLIATDVAGRGIHIDGVSHVINYTLPYEPEDYVHRIGRTGRAGTLGTSISFACEEDAFYLPDIEAFIGQKLACINPQESLLTPPPKGNPPSESSSASASHHKPSSASGSRRPPSRRPPSRSH